MGRFSAADSAQLVQRGQFSAAVLELRPFGVAVSAPGRFGTRAIQRLDDSALGRFGTSTTRRRDNLALRRFWRWDV